MGWWCRLAVCHRAVTHAVGAGAPLFVIRGAVPDVGTQVVCIQRVDGRGTDGVRIRSWCILSARSVLWLQEVVVALGVRTGTIDASVVDDVISHPES